MENITYQKIGILGGSFDPIHQGHLNIAESAYQEFALDEVWFVPTGHSPNKNEQGMTQATARVNMTLLAIAPYPYFKLSRIEVDEKGTSYTYLTLMKLKQQYPDAEFYFIMGADSLDYFEQWRHPEIICENAIVLTAVRDDMDITEIESKIATLQTLFPARIYPVSGGRTDISSTRIREMLREGEKPALLPDDVWNYIKSHHLYENA